MPFNPKLLTKNEIEENGIEQNRSKHEDCPALQFGDIALGGVQSKGNLAPEPMIAVPGPALVPSATGKVGLATRHLSSSAAAMHLYVEDDLFADLPPELAAVASTLELQANALDSVYQANDGVSESGGVPAKLLAAVAAVDSSRRQGEQGQAGGSRPGSRLRRTAQIAAAAIAVCALSLVNWRAPHQEHIPSAVQTTTQVREAPVSPRQTVHPAVFSELSGAEQEALLDLLSEMPSAGSI